MIVMGIPVLNKPEITNECIGFLTKSVQSKQNFHLEIIDNASDKEYVLPGHLPFSASVLRNNENLGFYYPIVQLSSRYPDASIIGVMHNDLSIYEYGWDERLRSSFEDDSRLGVVGFVGSNEIDEYGGRGGGTMCNFRGERGQLQKQTGRKVQGLHPALILDSLFMAFRASIVPDLKIPDSVPPAHFWDKILPMRARELGFKAAVLGIDCDHYGGATIPIVEKIDPKYDDTMRTWCEKWGIDPADNAGMAVYLEAERQWLTEYRDQKRMIPSRIDDEPVFYSV